MTAKKEKPWPTWDVMLGEARIHVRLNAHTPSGKALNEGGAKSFDLALPDGTRAGHYFTNIDKQAKCAASVPKVLRQIEERLGVVDSMWSVHNGNPGHYTDAKVKTQKVWSLCVACTNWTSVCGRPVFEEDRANGAVLCRMHTSAERRKADARVQRAQQDAEREETSARVRLMQAEFDELWAMACDARGVERSSDPRVAYGDPSRVIVDSEVLAMFLREIIG